MDSPNISPFIYQDLMDSNYGIMPNLGNPFMTGMYPTNLLGGTRLPAQPDGDKFMRMQERDQKDKNVFLKSMAALFIIGGSAALLFKGKINYSKFWQTTKNAVTAPFKWAGKTAKNGCKAAGNGIVSAGKGTKKGLAKAGHVIAAPFKWLGRNIKNGSKKAGHAIASPFKWIKNKIKTK